MILRTAKWLKRNLKKVRVWPPWPSLETWEANFGLCSNAWFVVVASMAQFSIGAGAAVAVNANGLPWPVFAGAVYFSTALVMTESLSMIRRAVRGEFNNEDWSSTLPQKFNRKLRKAREQAGIKQHEEI